MRRQLSDVADESAIPEDLIGVIDRRHEQQIFRLYSRSGRDIQVTAVPGKSAVSWMALYTPRRVGADRLPPGIIKVGRSPGWIISRLKLPVAVNGDSALADVFQIQ